MSVHVTLGDTTYQYPDADGWVVDDNGTLTISTKAGDDAIEQGVHVSWDGVYDPNDCTVVVREAPHHDYWPPTPTPPY